MATTFGDFYLFFLYKPAPVFWFLHQACSYLYIYSYKDNLWFKARELIYAWKI